MLKQITYRKDVEGIRGLAVLMVVFYHLRVPYVSSGLLGVDIFFVISGFLITSIIFTDIEKNSFSIKSFYLSRMRRILPALLLMLFSTSIVSVIILPPRDLVHYSSSLLASLMSISNIYFWKIVPVGYFSYFANRIPLLHTWSLGVEEQFYIFWPFFLLVVVRFFSKRRIFLVCSIIAFCSLLSTFFLWHSGYDGAAFYCPLFRAFELLAGCLFALYRQKIPTLPKIFGHIFSSFGLVLIILVGCFVKPNNSFSGLWEAVICFGTVLLIYTGERDKTLASKLLCSPVLTFFGLISYSLYLWHWPLLVFTSDFFQMTFQVKVLIFSASTALAFFSWKYIENPFRKNIKFTFFKTFIYFLLLPAIFSSIFLLLIKITHGYENRFTKKEIKMYNSSMIPGYTVLGKCFNGNPDKPESKKKCSIGSKVRVATQVLLVGDSHAAMDINMLSFLLKHADLKGYVVTLGATPYLPGVVIPDLRKKDTISRNRVITNIIKKNHFKYVVMGGAWAVYYDRKSSNYNPSYSQLKNGLINALTIVTEQSAIPVILLDIPPPLNVRKNCFVVSEAFGFKDFCKINARLAQKIQFKSKQMILDLKKKFPTLVFIDPTKVMCNKKICFSEINQNFVYSDNNGIGADNSGHMSASASSEIGHLYLKKYKNPF